jgi:membrane-associated phospholipid phosphatase
MLFLTDFADQAVLLPLALLVGLAFAAAGWRRGAIAWVVAVAVTFAAILAAKVAVDVWLDFLQPETGLRSPSGHTAAAAVTYGGLLALLAPRRWRPRWSAPLAAALVAAVIGTTRLALHLHSRADVLSGAVIGIAGVMLLAQLAGERPPGMRRALPLIAAVGVMILCHGEHLDTEEGIACASHLTQALADCVAPN